MNRLELHTDALTRALPDGPRAVARVGLVLAAQVVTDVADSQAVVAEMLAATAAYLDDREAHDDRFASANEALADAWDQSDSDIGNAMLELVGAIATLADAPPDATAPWCEALVDDLVRIALDAYDLAGL